MATIGLISCQKETSLKSSLKVEHDSIGSKKVYFLKIDISNNSPENIYLTNFVLTNYLRIYNAEGKDFTLNYLENESFEDNEEFYRKWSNKNAANSFYSFLKDEAIKADYKRITGLNFFLRLDPARINSLNRAIAGKYENMLIIKSGETATLFYSINSLTKIDEKFKIVFKYPNEHAPSLFPGLMRCYKQMDGRDEKFLVFFITPGVKKISDYVLYRRKIISDPVFVNLYN